MKKFRMLIENKDLPEFDELYGYGVMMAPLGDHLSEAKLLGHDYITTGKIEELLELMYKCEEELRGEL